MPEELHEQVPVMKEVLAAMEIPILTREGYEADDILGTAAKKAQAMGIEVSIVSGDRDLLQLADTHIKIRIPKTSRGTTEIHDYYPEDVKREYQVTPEEFIDVKALMGDASDNIPGVPSIGEKTATNLIVQYHSLENIYAHLDEVKPPRAKKALEEHKDMAELSRTLAKICIDAPIDFSLDDAKIGKLYTQAAYDLMARLGFKSLLQRFGAECVSENSVEETFTVIRDFSEAENFLKKAQTAEKAGAQLFIDKDEIFGLSVCLDGKESAFLPAEGFLTGSYLADALTSLCKAREIWVLDLKSQLPFLNLNYGDVVCDAGVAAYLLNPLTDTYEYDDLARDYLGLTVPSKTDLFGKKGWKAVWEEDEDAVKRCACYTAYTACMAAEPLKKALHETGMEALYHDIELPLIYALYHMEEEGIEVRREELRAYGEKLKGKIEILEKEIWQETGCEFNINSPKQLGEVLFETMKIKGGKKTKTGYSTAADVLEKLRHAYPIVDDVLCFRQYTKLKSTYVDGLMKVIDMDGRIRTSFQMTVTATGRLSSTEPNLQNIPTRTELGSQLRRMFTAAEGCVLVDADYSQIELRLLAHMSGDKVMQASFLSGTDFHTATAAKVFHVPEDEVTPELRRRAKAVNFGIVYGISAFALAQDIGVTVAEAKAYMDRYFETYSTLRQYMTDVVAQAEQDGYVQTMMHRRRPLPELKSSNFNLREFGKRVALNMPVQGSAADIMKLAMVRVHDRLKREGLRARLLMQVHDELIVECPEGEAEQVQRLLAEEMEHVAELAVPLTAEAHAGKSWAEAKG